jgi:hypothetical protein
MLSENQAADLAYEVRRRLTAGEIDTYDFAVFDALLWGARQKGCDRVRVAYSRLQKLAHVCRDKLAKSIAKLAKLGLFQVVKSRVLVLMENGGKTWKQLANIYVFSAIRRESVRRTEKIQHTKILREDGFGKPVDNSAAGEHPALAERRMAMEGRLRWPK